MAVLLWTAAVIAVLLAAGFAYEKWQEASDRRRYPPPGKLVDIGGQRLHIFCQGDAPGPTVVIEDPLGYALCVRPQHAAVCAADMTAMANAPADMRQPDQPGSLGDRPLVVLEHGIPFPRMAAAMEEGWSDGMRRLARLSTNSQLVIAPKSGHLIYLDEPELIVESVRQVVAASASS